MIKVWLQQGRGLWLALFLGLLLPALVQAEEAPPGLATVPLDRRVIDLTATLDDASQARMVRKLEALEQRRGAQIVVMLVPSLGQQSIEALSNQLFRAWKLGRKGVDDGILLLVAKNDHKVRIEVGYGLEPVVTDLLAGQIIALDLTPAFRQGDFAGGIDRALDDLILLVDGGSLPEAAGLPEFVGLSEPVGLAVPLEAYALLLAFIFGSVAGVMLAAGWNWRRVLGGAVVLMAVLVGAVGGHEWLAQLFLVPLCMLIGGATFAGLWQARRVFYGVLGLLLYIGLLTLVSQYLGRLTFLYGLAWPAGVLLVLGGHWLLYWMMRNSWRRSPRGFLWRFAVLLTLVLLMGLGVDAWQAVQRWLTVVPFAYFLSFMLFASGSGFRWSSGGGSGGGSGSSSSSSSSSGGGFSGGGGSSGGGGASGSW